MSNEFVARAFAQDPTNEISNLNDQIGNLSKLIINIWTYANLVTNPGTANEDWIPAINQAIADATATWPHKTIKFPGGYIYRIGSPINSNVAGYYCGFIGDGYQNTVIRANAAMSVMLALSQSTGYHGEKLVKGIQFDGNFLASCGIDATYLRYSTIEENEIKNIAPNGWAIKCGNWTVRIKNNIVNGQDSTSQSVPSSNGIYVVAGAINNLIIKENSLTCCHLGLQCDATSNDIHIVHNNFDTCDNAAIWMTLAGRNVEIENNYFENCGKGAGVTVAKSSSTNETWNGVIILHSAYNVVYTYFFENLVIQKNEFANCYTGSIITASGLSKAEIKNNHVLTGYNYTNFLNLKWVGCSYIFANRIYVEVNETGSSQFTQVVGLNTDNNKQNLVGLVIKHYLSGGDGFNQAIYRNGFELTTPENWNDSGGGYTSGAWTVNANGLYQDVYPIRQITATANSKYKIIDLTQDANKFIRGQYLRFNVLSKGDTVNNSLWVDVYIDGTNVLDVYNESNGTFANVTNNTLVYVPTTANQLVIRAHVVDTANTVSYTKFNISLANKDPENLTFVTSQ